MAENWSSHFAPRQVTTNTSYSPGMDLNLVRQVQAQQAAARSAGGGSSGAGTGAGGQPLLGQIGQHLAGLQDQAKAANQARFDKMMGLAQQFGATQQRRNAQLTQQEAARGQSSMLSRGLGNSTVGDTMRQGILRQGQDRAMDINQRVAEQQAGILGGVTDQYPNLGMYASLLSQPGALAGDVGGLLAGMFGLGGRKR